MPFLSPSISEEMQNTDLRLKALTLTNGLVSFFIQYWIPKEKGTGPFAATL